MHLYVHFTGLYSVFTFNTSAGEIIIIGSTHTGCLKIKFVVSVIKFLLFVAGNAFYLSKLLLLCYREYNYYIILLQKLATNPVGRQNKGMSNKRGTAHANFACKKPGRQT